MPTTTYSDFVPRIIVRGARAQIRVQGPIQQARGGSGSHWAGAYTPDEMDRFALELVRTAQKMRED